jgi:hypothetical protein
MWWFATESLHKICRMGRLAVVMKLICSLGDCESDSRTVRQLGQWRLTADWLAPRENDCSQMRSKVFSDWLPSYIKATRPVLEIFNTAGYFRDSPFMCMLQGTAVIYTHCTSVCYSCTDPSSLIGHYLSNPFMALSLPAAIIQGKTVQYFVAGGRKLFCL